MKKKVELTRQQKGNCTGFWTRWRKNGHPSRQKAAQKKKIQDSLAKSKGANKFVDIILKKCKDHAGPLTSVKDLDQFV